MIATPDRLSSIVATLEAGNDPTADQLRRINELQALDLAKAGRDFADEALARDRDAIETLRAI